MARRAAAARDTAVGHAAITINPATNDLTLNPTDIQDESITVTIPKGNKCKNVKLVPSASIAPFIDSINPPGGFGPITGEQDQTLSFRVRFRGIPCTPKPQVFTGTLDVVCDGRVIARKEVKITVPACPPTVFVYSAKFICGEQSACGCECTSVQPGRYATEINIHNYGTKEVAVQKRFVPLVLAGAPVGREPRVGVPAKVDAIRLPAQSATMDDCCRILELVLGAPPSGQVPITIGIMEVISAVELAVTAVYTASNGAGSAPSIEVVQIVPRRLIT
jgi:hypothetical protein